MIRDIQELNFPSYATMSAASVSLPDMGEWNITSQIKVDGQITPDFTYDWEVLYKGHKFIMPLRKPQGNKDNTSINATVDLAFKHWAMWQLQRFFFFESASVQAGTIIPDKFIASVELNLENFCVLFARVLEYWYGDKITLDVDQATIQNATSDVQKVEINYAYMWDVLLKFYEVYGVRWSIEPNGDADHYVIKIRYGSPNELSHIFEYGFKGGLLKVERQVQNPDIRNVILGRGGGKNLPYRYFKNTDPNNASWPADPDWIPELATLPFTQLHGATFRSYIRGWKAKHYGGTTTAADCYAPWAWQKGYTDAKFNPVEFVYDADSINLYGELWGALEDNDSVYPTIQGRVRSDIGRVDEVVAVEPITSDDYAAKSEKESQIYNANLCNQVSVFVKKNGATATVKLVGGSFTVPQGMTAVFDEGTPTAIAYDNPRFGAAAASARGGRAEAYDKYLEPTVKSIMINSSSSAQVLVAGTYTWSAEIEVKNTSAKDLTATVSLPTPKVIASDISQEFSNTWRVWIKDVFDTPKPANQSAESFAAEVWDSLLGDHLGNEAALFFTSGILSTSEDYKFLLVKRPEYDSSKSINVPGVGQVQSMWKLTLQKSDADLEATDLWLPSTMRQASAGDHFAFEGIELPHKYVLMAEEEIDNAKVEYLLKFKDIKPTWIVSLDRVRISSTQEGEVSALINQITPGASVRLHDPRFILNEQGTPAAYETLYISNVNITYREPTSDDAALNPDVEITLSDKYEMAATTVQRIQSEIDALNRQVGSLGNIEQLIRAVGDKLYLRKDGIEDISMSPTQFFSLLTSGDFRSGMVGGAGWGFFRDANGNWVLETDRVNVRQEMLVNSLVVNQVKGQGGSIVEGAAVIENVTEVIADATGINCYFDTKNGTVFNQFRVDDVAYCHRYVPTTAADNTTAAFGTVKFYKRRVIEVGDNYIRLSVNPAEINGSGIPSEGDSIIHYGNYSDANRQYVKVRDVIGGGYERYLENLNSVNAAGTEYYFIGRQAGVYNNRPRFYIGDANGYIEWVNGELNIKGKINMLSTIGNKPINQYISEAAQAAAPPNLLSEYSSDAANWHPNPVSGDVWMRTSNDGGATWGAAVRIQGASYTDNIILNSIFKDGLSKWYLDGVSGVVSEDAAIGNFLHITSPSGQKRFYQLLNNVWYAGQKYTYSFFAKAATAGVQIRASRSLGDVAAVHTLTTSWVKYYGVISCTATVSDGTLSIQCLNGSGFDITKIKLEYGNNSNPQWTPAAPEMIGTNYSPNILLNSESVTVGVSSDIGYPNNSYKIINFDTPFDVKVGDKITLSVENIEVLAGSATSFNAWLWQQSDGAYSGKLTLTQSNKTGTFTVTKALTAKSLVIYAGEYENTSGKTVRWDKLMLVKGETAAAWTPAASEMLGKDGKWRKFQWALGTETTVTGTWQDTPMSAPAGQYVWMRSGLVTPPATNPTTWETATRLTGDKGQAGDSVYLLDLSDEMMPMPCDAGGNVVGTYKTSVATVYKGGTAVTSGITYSIAQQTGVSATVTAAGVVTPSNLTADRGTIVVQAVVAGVTLQTTLSLYKVKPGADYAANIFPSTYFNLTEAGARLTKAGNLQNQITTGNFRYFFINAYKPIKQAGWYSLSMWAKTTSGTTTVNIDINDCALITNKALDTTWTQITASVYVNKYIGQFGFMDILVVSGTAANVRISDVVVTPTEAPLDSWVPTAEEMVGQDGAAAVVYQLELSANNVSRNSLGQLSTSSITVQKYKTTGAAARVLTTEKKIRYQRLGVDTGYTEVQSGVSSTAISVPDNPLLTAIVVELIDTDNSVLDRERIPLIQDGTELTENLVLNSDKEADTSVSVWATYKTSESIKDGEYYTFTVWTNVSNASAFDLTLLSGNNLPGFNPGSGEVFSLALPKISGGIYSASAQVDYQTNVLIANYIKLHALSSATHRVLNVKVEKGINPCPVWTQSTHEVDYLKSAMQESGSMEGGLILASLMRMGYTDSTGTYKVKAGVNGIADPDDALAFWAGGEMIDPDKQPSASNLPKYGVRHNGTAFAAGNTIRFKPSLIEVGDYINLDKDGLKMIINQSKHLVVGNETVDGSDVLTAFSRWDLTSATTWDMYNSWYYNGSAANGFALYLNAETIKTEHKTSGMGYVPKNKTLTISGKYSLNSGGFAPTSNYKVNRSSVPKLVITIYDNTTVRKTFTIQAEQFMTSTDIFYDLSNVLYDIEAPISNLIIGFKFTQTYTSVPSGWNQISQAVTAQPYDTAIYATLFTEDFNRKDTAILGVNGTQFSWGDTHQYQQNGLWGVRSGRNGIRISPEGIFVMTNGETAVSLESYIREIIAKVSAKK